MFNDHIELSSNPYIFFGRNKNADQSFNSDPLQYFLAIGIAFAFVYSLKTYDRHSIVHLNYTVIKGKSSYAHLIQIKYPLRKATK
ncbi:hypothetical protein V1477_001425 [Vespula maculifrons]|uniref:Uncharacterized protein n=1 Tax=Vespula maculifrons TaxID=7453 RepID=A0ABD2CYX8_VESMC